MLGTVSTLGLAASPQFQYCKSRRLPGAGPRDNAFKTQQSSGATIPWDCGGLIDESRPSSPWHTEWQTDAPSMNLLPKVRSVARHIRRRKSIFYTMSAPCLLLVGSTVRWCWWTIRLIVLRQPNAWVLVVHKTISDLAEGPKFQFSTTMLIYRYYNNNKINCYEI